VSSVGVCFLYNKLCPMPGAVALLLRPTTAVHATCDCDALIRAVTTSINGHGLPIYVTYNVICRVCIRTCKL
jgi:hypothetical protein